MILVVIGEVALWGVAFLSEQAAPGPSHIPRHLSGAQISLLLIQAPALWTPTLPIQR